MEDSKDTVTNSEETVASQQEQAPQEQVTDQTEEVSSASTPATGEPTQEIPSQETQVTRPQVEAVDEHGVPWKNRAMEAQKRFDQMPDVIKQTVQEALAAKEQKPQYSKEHIPHLRQYAMEHPEQAQWVENTIEDIRANETKKVVAETLTSFQRQQQDTLVRQQSEAWVANHPEFKGCFTSDPYGNKVWNMTNPLTQMMSQILNQPDPVTGKLVKDRPDGLAVAAELAYGRYALSNKTKVATQVTTLKRDLRKVQKQTVTQGVGTGNAPQAVSSVRKALDNYNRTYNKKDMQEATKEFLRQQGVLKEE